MNKSTKFGYIALMVILFGATVIAIMLKIVFLAILTICGGTIVSFVFLFELDKLEKEKVKKNLVQLQCKVLKKFMYNSNGFFGPTHYFLVEVTEPNYKPTKITIPVYMQVYHAYEIGDMCFFSFEKHENGYKLHDSWS